MEFYQSLRIFSLSGGIIFLLSSCQLSNSAVNNDFYRVNQRFAEVELRFGEGSNESCVLHLTKEGIIGRASSSFYSGDNEYFFRAINTIDSTSIKRIQEIVINSDYFITADSCYCSEGSSLVPPRITIVSNPITHYSKVIYDKNFTNENRSSVKELDELWEAMESLIPNNFKNGNCWE